MVCPPGSVTAAGGSLRAANGPPKPPVPKNAAPRTAPSTAVATMPATIATTMIVAKYGIRLSSGVFIIRGMPM